MINLECRNTRGLNDPLKKVEVRNLIRIQNFKICGLVETRVQVYNKDKVRHNIQPT